MSEKTGRSKPPPTRRSAAPAARDDLGEAITALRDLMDRAVTLAAQEDCELNRLADFLNKYSQSCIRLASLLKTQRMLAGVKDPGEALHQALNQVLENMPGVSRQGGQ